eukprot:2297947-Prymnesium_polylepis.1
MRDRTELDEWVGRTRRWRSAEGGTSPLKSERAGQQPTNVPTFREPPGNQQRGILPGESGFGLGFVRAET